MKRIISLILSFLPVIPLTAGSIVYDENHILYSNETTHLWYMLNTKTKEAMLGDGINDEKNALYYPPQGDEWWNNQINFWKNIEVPSTIEFENEVYTVTKIAEKAFYKCTEIETIKLPNTIKEIGSNAFYFSTKLKSITLQEGIKTINSGAFGCCISLKEIKLPSTVKSIGTNAFIDCKLLTRINIPGDCEFIGNDAFSWCISLSALQIEDGEKPINLGYATSFGPLWQAHMEPYYYPKTFYRGLFNDCPLKELYIGRDLKYDNVLNIKSPFESCYYREDDSLGKPIILRDGRSYDKVCFGGNVTDIHAYLFYDAVIPEIVLPDNLRRIGNYAFYNAVDQKTLLIPERCDSIGEFAFKSKDNPQTLKYLECKAQMPPKINEYSFYMASPVVSVPYGTRDVYCSSNNWDKYKYLDSSDELVEIDVKYANSLYGRLSFLDYEPQGIYRLKLTGVLGADDWNVIMQMSNLYELDLSNTNVEDISPIQSLASRLVYFEFPQGVKTISSDLFYNTKLKGTIRIPQSCELIETNAFSKSLIEEVIISGPTTVESSAFSYCDYLSKINISGGANLLESSFSNIYKFENPKAGLETLIIGDRVKVNKNAFLNCKHLTHIIINDRVDTLYNYAFQNCDNIKKLTYNGSVSYIEGNPIPSVSLDTLEINDINGWMLSSFSAPVSNPMSQASNIYINGKNNYDLVVPDSINVVSNYAFYNCNALNSAIIQGQGTTIGNGCFALCRNLSNIEFQGKHSELRDSCFYSCTRLTNITFPQSASFGTSTFNDCTSLTAIQMPADLDTIPQYLCKGCAALQSVSIPATVKYIGRDAFNGCASICNIVLPASCETIESSAFYGCSSIEELVLPHHISTIGDGAFTNCINLKRIQALWDTAPQIPYSVFTGINNKCILYVPVGSVSSYYEKGWGRIPLIDEGFCVVYLINNEYGAVTYNGKEYIGYDDAIALDFHSDASLEIIPYDKFYMTDIILDGEYLQPGIHKQQITLNDIINNHTIQLSYKKYVLGDVNDDNYIDVGDISHIVGYIQNKTNPTFIAAAADTNIDDDIDVGDIRGVVNLIYDYANIESASVSKISTREQAGTYDISVSCKAAESSGEYLLEVFINNSTDISGFQFDLIIPQNMRLQLDGNGNPCYLFNDERTYAMNIKSFAQIGDNHYRVICSATNQNVIEQGDGKVLSLTFTADKGTPCSRSEIQLPDIRVADRLAQVYSTSAVCEFFSDGLTTGITNMSSNLKESSCKYIKKGQIFIKKGDEIYFITGIKK